MPSQMLQRWRNIMTKLSTIFQLLTLFFIISCSAQQNSYEKAKKLVKQNDFKDALEILNNIISQNPKFDSAYLKRAYCFMELGNIQSSLNDYNHLITIPSFKIAALDGRAALYYKIMQYQKAIDDFTEIINLDKNNYHAYYNRGIVKTEFKIYGTNPDTNSLTTSFDESGKSFYYDYNGALEDYNKAIDLNPSYVDTYVIRGKLFIQLQKNAKALSDFNQAIHLDTSYFDAYLERAVLYKDMNDTNKSLADFDKAIEINPKDPFTYINRAYLKRDLLHDKDGACKDFNKAEELGLNINADDKKDCN